MELGRIELSSQASQALMPEVGDLVVTTVTRVEDYGAYVKLDEFSGIEGLVHISEISTTWVRNIREHARQGQKLVLKVLRISSQRNQIDLSLRRVTGREKSEKMLEWKKERKAEAILTSAADKLKKSAEDAEDIKKILLDKFGGLYSPLEEALDEGPEVLVKGGLTVDVAQAITEVTKKKIRKPRGSEVKIYSIGSPKYRIEVEASSFEAAEKTLSLAVEEALGTIKKAGGEGRKLG